MVNFFDFFERLKSSFIDSKFFYRKKQYISPTRKIYLELDFRKSNVIAFSLNEILFNRKKRLLTNVYFYPSSNVCWLLFLEINSKRFLITREVLKTLLLCFLVVEFLNNEYSSLSKNKTYFSNSIIIQKLKKNFTNIKIISWS